MIFPLKAKKKKSILQKNKQKQQQQKKDKLTLMQKLLSKNKIVSMLSHQPKKLMKLAKKGGNIGYKNIEQVALLPKLTLKQLFPQIEQLTQRNQKINNQFNQVNQELTCSMIQFHNKFIRISQQQQGRILDLQTKKCYTHIPQHFFKQLSSGLMQKLVMKNKRQAAQETFIMIDYNDQIQYNISQQVNYKMKLFIDFATFLKGVADLVDIACKKINATRSKNNIIREIIIKRSINIHILRTKQENYTKTIKILQQMKKIKLMQKSLMSLIHAKGKCGVGQAYEQYCIQHQKVRQFCCCQHLCNFGDLKYYVQRNYHQTFNKSMQNYIGQLVNIQKKKLVQIIKPIKSNYISTPFDNKAYQNNQKQGISLDETIQMDDEFQIVIKGNIEKQISKIFKFGLDKCTYSTDNLCIYIKQQLQQIQLTVYSSILENVDKVKQDLFDNFVKFALNKPSEDSLKINIGNKSLSHLQKIQLINKLITVKYLQITELLSKKLMDLSIRCYSIVNQLLKILKCLQRKQPQKQQIISAYLIQIIIIVIGFVNTSFGSFLQLRQLKQNQIQITDKFIAICQQWQSFIDQSQNKYQYVWRKLIFHFSDYPNLKANHKLKMKRVTSFQDLQQFVQENYLNDQIQGSKVQSFQQDSSQELISKKQIKYKMLSKIIRTKNQKINFNFYTFLKSTIGKQLSKRIQNQTWTTISMNSNVSNSVGFIIYGDDYLKKQNKFRNSSFLSRSLLIQKSHLGSKKVSQQQIPSQTDEQFQIKTTQAIVKIKQRSFRLVGVSQYILEVIHHSFIYFDRYFFDQESQFITKQTKEVINQKSHDYPTINSSLILQKSIQIVIILAEKIKHYLNNLKDYQKKIKSFAKFILIAFSQLQFFKCLILNLFQRKKRFQNDKNLNQKQKQKQLNELKKNFIKQIDQIIQQIVKKYNSISYEKIKESIKKLQINPKKQITIPSETTQQILIYFSKSISILASIIIDKTLYWKFMNFAWIKIYLQRVNEQSNILRKYVMKSNGSGGGHKIQQINWETKLQWKQKQLQYLLMQIQAQNYSEHIKELNVIQNQLKKQKEKNHNK